MDQGPEAILGDHWSTHLLTEFIAMVLSYSDVDTAYVRGVERIAEALEAEVGAIVGGDDVLAVVGFPRRAVPHASLVEIARIRPKVAELPRLGPCVIEVVPFDDEAETTLLVGRLDGSPFTRPEASLLRGMTRTLLLCTRMLRTLAAERALRETSEVLVAVERAIAQRAPLQDVLDAITSGAQRLLRVEIALLQLHDPTDASSMLLASSQGLSGEVVEALHGAAADSAMAQAASDQGLVVIEAGTDVAGGLRAQAPEVGSIMAAPVSEGSAVIGVLAVATLDRGRQYLPVEQELLIRFAEHASLALTDARTVEQLSQAMLDPLTGLSNRGLFIDRLRQALARADQSGARIALLFCDLDGFKGINDSLGHTTGDAVLRIVADRLRASIRDADIAARLGGDEFAILLEDVRQTTRATSVAERIIDKMSSTTSVDGRQVNVGMSIGVVLREAGEEGADELLRNADLAMYRSKESGTGVTIYESWMHERLLDRVTLDADLRHALDAGQLQVYYQPVLDLASRKVNGVEALARWHHPSRGMVPPSVFIPLAEEIGLIQRLGAAILCDACDDVQGWRRTFPQHAGLRLSVNMSAHQLHDPSLVDQVRDALERSGLPAENLTLEITESALVEDPRGVARRLGSLRELGARVAIDDFGTGYSSLSYLRQFPADILKIDKVFIDDIVGPGSGALARAIVRLAQALGLQTIAEGIEDPVQAVVLTGIGCNLGQGYAFGKPVPAHELADYLAGESGRARADDRVCPA